jgi:hypothetical protein
MNVTLTPSNVLSARGVGVFSVVNWIWDGAHPNKMIIESSIKERKL